MNRVKINMIQRQTAANDSQRRQIRNLGVAAHIDAGKTTLTERVLFYTGAIHKAGNVDDGTTTTDFDPIEQRKGITIFAAAVSCSWTPQARANVVNLFPGVTHQLNVIDTPGHVDFTAEVERSLRVLDGMIAVFCAVGGVQPQSETVWRQANRYGVPRIAFINKMDRVGANFERVVDELRGKLGANAWPVMLPWGSEDGLRGQLDVINECAYAFANNSYTVEAIPPEARERIAAARTELVSCVADLDDEVAALWLVNSPVSATTLKAAIRRATLANRFVPVIAGSAYRFVGVQPLLDAVLDYLPSPADNLTAPAHFDGDIEGVLQLDSTEPVAALAFKVAHDEQKRRVVFLRIYAGALRKGDIVLNPRTGKRERIGRLLRLFADRREDVAVANAGDIVAAVSLKGFSTGDTACDPARPVQLERPVFPDPVVSMALEPYSSADRERLGEALSALSDEDPTFRTYTNAETGQSIIAGMGELHLEVIRERLETNHGVRVAAGAPDIAYRETIAAAAEVDHLLRKQNGGPGQYARVVLSVRPNERGRGLSLENLVTGGNIPPQYLKAVRLGVQEGLREGVRGYPVVDIHVDILDGDAHEKDSNDMAFELAAAAAVREAVRKAKPLLLEPVMKVEVDTPSEEQGDLLGDLSRRRGAVLGLESSQGNVLLRAEVPLAELWGYANAIRSLSRGRASYSMTPSHFERVPEALTSKIVNGCK